MIVDSTNPRIMADNIRKLAVNGGSGLPKVTESDNGKILGVVEGSWDKMNAPIGLLDYSETEQNTSRKWIDGSPIYQKTYVFTNELAVSYDSWTETEIPVGDINNIIGSEAFNSSGSNWGVLMVTVDNTEYVKLSTTRNSVGVEVKYLTLFYTKTPTQNEETKKTTKRKTTKGEN